MSCSADSIMKVPPTVSLTLHVSDTGYNIDGDDNNNY